MSLYFVEQETLVRPKALQKGDTIAIVAPAKHAEKEGLAESIHQLKQMGYPLRLASNLAIKNGYFAGEDTKRAAAFMECWCDPTVKAVWCFNGGYGCSPLLDHLDFEEMRRHPKVFIGMSDVTALHAAIGQRCQLVTFLGPNLCSQFQYPTYTQGCLWKMISSVEKQVFSYPRETSLETLQSGQAEGRLVGGNLALVSALMGTPYQLQTREKILVLEDVNEAPYRIDRMLNQLKQGGLFDHLAGVLLCSWRNCRDDTTSKNLTLSQVFERYFSDAPYPVLAGFPSGHISEQVTLPLNCLAMLDADHKTVRLLEEAVV